MLSVKKIALESFAIEPSEIAGGLSVRLSGTGDTVAVEPLRDCLEQIRADMIRLKLKHLEIDIRSLYLLNSSCIKSLVRFLYILQTDGPNISVGFSVDKNLSWQARALSPLTRMAPDIVKIAS